MASLAAHLRALALRSLVELHVPVLCPRNSAEVAFVFAVVNVFERERDFGGERERAF